MEYTVNDITLSYTVEGNTHRGKDEVLLSKAVDLTAGTPWHHTGLIIETLFSARQYELFIHETYNLLVSLWCEAGLMIPDHFQVWQYHSLATDAATHLSAIEKTRLLS